MVILKEISLKLSNYCSNLWKEGEMVTKHNNNNGGKEQSLVLRMMYTVTDSKIRIYYYSVTIYKNR